MKSVTKQMKKCIVTGLFALVMMLVLFPTQKVKAATAINVNQKYTKAFNDSEYEMYMFQSPTDGYFSVKGTIIEQESDFWGRDTDILVLDSAGNEIVYSIGLDTLNKTETTELFATKAGQTFYVKIDNSNSWDARTIRFNVAYTGSNKWENEFNDSAKTACTLSNNTNKYGTITRNDTYDYFKFKVKKNSKVVVTFGPKEISGNDNEWIVDIINSNNDTTTLFSGVSSVNSATVYLKKGTYYLRVKNGYNAENVAYMIKYKANNFTVKTPKITSVSIKKNGSSRYLNKISLKNNIDIAGYTVQVAKKKSMSGKYINTNVTKSTDNNYVTKKVIRFADYTYDKYLASKKTTYYVRVRGFVQDPFENLIYGSYSKVKKVTK